MPTAMTLDHSSEVSPKSERPHIVHVPGRNFPQELMDKVFEHCEKPALWRLRSVNHFFYEVTKRILFRAVALAPGCKWNHRVQDDRSYKHASANQRLVDCIAQFPHLARYVEQAELDVRMSHLISPLYRKATRSQGSPEIRRFLLNEAFGALQLFVAVTSIIIWPFTYENDYDKDFLSALIKHGSAMSFWETVEQLRISEITGEEAGRRLISKGLKKANQLRELDLSVCDEYSIAHYLNSPPLLLNLRTLSIEIEDLGYRNSLLGILPAPDHKLKPFKALTTLAIKSSEDLRIHPNEHQELLDGSSRPAKFPALQHLGLDIRTSEFESFWPFMIAAAPLLQSLSVSLTSSRSAKGSAVSSMTESVVAKPIELEHLHTVSLSCRFSDIPLLWYDTPDFAPCLSTFHLSL